MLWPPVPVRLCTSSNALVSATPGVGLRGPCLGSGSSGAHETLCVLDVRAARREGVGGRFKRRRYGLCLSKPWHCQEEGTGSPAHAESSKPSSQKPAGTASGEGACRGTPRCQRRYSEYPRVPDARCGATAGDTAIGRVARTRWNCQVPLSDSVLLACEPSLRRAGEAYSPVTIARAKASLNTQNSA